MKTANYIGATTATGGMGKYPLSTETLNFIQDQIRLLEALAGIGGANYILRAPDGETGGVAVVRGADGCPEVLEIEPSPKFSPAAKYLTVLTLTEDIEADAETYKEARTLRRALFTSKPTIGNGVHNYDINTFANVSNRTLNAFPTNASLAAQIKSMPQTILNSLRDVLAEKLTAKGVSGLSQKALDELKTPMVLSCTASVALFDGITDYTVIVTAQGSKMVRQEVIQGDDSHYVRTFNGTAWGAWKHEVETAMHLDVKIVGTTVWLRHGALGSDCDIVLLRKKKRSAYRRTGGPNSYTANRGKKKKRQPKSQYVHFKGIRLSKGTPGQWYVPKCIAVADPKRDSGMIGKEMPTLCSSLFYQGTGGFYRIQGSRKRIILKSTTNKKGTCHKAYAPIGVQIARLKPKGGKDSGGEIVRMKYRISQRKDNSGRYGWARSFSQE